MDFEEMLEDFGSEDYIFHYTTLDTFYCHILKEGTLYFSDLDNKNDPHEFSKLSSISTQRSYLLSDKKGAENYEKSVISEILKLRPDVRFASFCKNDFKGSPTQIDCVSKLGCCRMRMWTQYAKNHTGVCIIFSKKKLFESVKRVLSNYEEHSLIPRLKDVHYVDFWEYKHFIPFDVSEYKYKVPLDLAHDYYLGEFSPLFMKDVDYSDECETRIIYLSRRLEYIECRDAMVGVVFGTATSEADRNFINQFNTVPILKKWWITNRNDLIDIVKL